MVEHTTLPDNQKFFILSYTESYEASLGHTRKRNAYSSGTTGHTCAPRLWGLRWEDQEFKAFMDEVSSN